MGSFIVFLRDFGSLVNLATVLAFLGFFLTLYKSKNDSTIEQQNARIRLLEQQLKIQGEFTVENVTERFRSLKEYYEVHIKDWYEKSLESLKLNTKHESPNDKEHNLKIDDEIAVRTELKEKYKGFLSQLQESKSVDYIASQSDFIGKFSTSGTNPGLLKNENGNYFGIVEIQKMGETFLVIWTLGSTKPIQTFIGTGVLTRNTLSVVFRGSSSAPNESLIGLIAYEIIGDSIIQGKWTGLGSEDIGYEQLRRIT